MERLELGLPQHVAIIMDGNGRWARRRGEPRIEGHRVGVDALRRTVDALLGLGIPFATFYAFSTANWKRPASEVGFLMNLLATYLHGELDESRSRGIRLNVIGRRDRLRPSLIHRVDCAERETAHCQKLLVRLAIDYGGRDVIARAARLGPRDSRDWDFDALVERACHSVPGVPAVDLMIRCGGEMRLSDFLLWESAYAELVFIPVLWPDFAQRDLNQAIDAFVGRERRFGGLPQSRACSMYR